MDHGIKSLQFTQQTDTKRIKKEAYHEWNEKHQQSRGYDLKRTGRLSGGTGGQQDPGTE